MGCQVVNVCKRWALQLPRRVGHLLLWSCLLCGASNPTASSPPIGSWLARKSCRMVPERLRADRPETVCSSLDGLRDRAARALSGATSPGETIERLNAFLFEAEGFHPTYDLTSPDHLLLDGVLVGKKGHCVGLATVYLVLAEELHLPIYAVATPKHVFVRWDDGKLRRNIELFQKGR